MSPDNKFLSKEGFFDKICIYSDSNLNAKNPNYWSILNSTHDLAFVPITLNLDQSWFWEMLHTESTFWSGSVSELGELFMSSNFYTYNFFVFWVQTFSFM